jgi:hypothetical protein
MPSNEGQFRYLQSLSPAESDLFLLSNLFSSAIVIEHETSFPFSFVVLLPDLHLAEKQFAPKQLKQKAGPASQWLAPFACRNSLPLGDLPLNLALSSSKKWMAVTNNGQSVQSLQLINTTTQKVVDNVIIPKSWYGLKFSRMKIFVCIWWQRQLDIKVCCRQ